MIGLKFDSKKNKLSAENSKSYSPEIRELLRKNIVQLKKIKATVFKLCHSYLIILEVTGLFTPMNKVLRENPITVGIGKISEFRQALKDRFRLIYVLARRQTHLN